MEKYRDEHVSIQGHKVCHHALRTEAIHMMMSSKGHHMGRSILKAIQTMLTCIQQRLYGIGYESAHVVNL